MNQLQIIEHEGIRVITTQQLADVYGTDSKVISNNFNRNKERYQEGKHFICLEGDDLKEFLRSSILGMQNKDKIRVLYLWTEKGAFLHAKSLNTDQAWDVYDRLVETYFNVRQSNIDRDQLSPQMQMFYAIADGQAKVELEQKRIAREIEEVKQAQSVMVDTFQKLDDTEDFQKWVSRCISQIAESPKFDKGDNRNQRYSMARTESYERLKQKRNCRLDDRVQKAIGRALEERPDIKKSDLQKINKIYIIANDRDLRIAYESVIKEMMIFYCVKIA